MKIRIAKKINKIGNAENNAYYALYTPWLMQYLELKKTSPYSLKLVALKFLKPIPMWTYSLYQRNRASKRITEYYKKRNK